MAGVLLVGADGKLSMKDLCKGGRDKRDPVVTSFEKELNFILRVVPSGSKWAPNPELGLKL